MQDQSSEVTYHLEANEFNWEVAPGKTIMAWGFNNQLPGPVLKAQAGETLVVKVKNNLPEPTIIHWHGIRLQATMDGTGEVQKPIQPGEEFEYRFIVPDAGTFWYHSHYNETMQVEKGMYGALIVEDKTDPVFDGEKVIMIDDMKLDTKNQFSKPSWFLPRIIERHDGREGDTLLINGKENPVIEINAGHMERWRIINSSSARYFNLSFEGREFRIIGTDGGLIESPIIVTRALITPGERLDIAVGPFNEGERFALESTGYNRTTFLKPKRQSFATVTVKEKKPSIANLPQRLRTIEPLAQQQTPASRKVELSVGPSLRNGMNFLINNKMHLNDEPVRVGDLQVWEINNSSLMDHPYHLHGFFFQVIEENGIPPEYKAWKDTYNIKPKTRVKIAWMPDDRKGTWMYHCHILEHHAAGMMANFKVIDKDHPGVEKHFEHVHIHDWAH